MVKLKVSILVLLKFWSFQINNKSYQKLLKSQLKSAILLAQTPLVQFLLAPLEIPKLSNAQPSNFGPLVPYVS